MDVLLKWAVDKTGASRFAVDAVLTAMQDGVERSDEQIANIVRRRDGRPYAPDTIRHARLALCLGTRLKWTGKVTKTRYGKPTQTWALREKA